MKISYWNTKNNFGDCITPVLLERLFNIKSEWCEPDETEFIGSGSLLETFSKGYKGYVWGTGKMFEESEIDLSKAKVLALRGYLTKAKTKCDCEVFGDPGLLCKLIAPKKVKKTNEVGIIPHWNDKDLVNCDGEILINITDDIDKIIKQVASCKKIISSSLHGIILADALNIPRQWWPSEMNPGGAFKFNDYQSVFGGIIKPYRWYKADKYKVNEICHNLLQVLKPLCKNL
jgi:pyruvyltransferase